MASFYVGPFLIVLWLFCEVATLENPLDGKQLRCCALEQFPSLYKNAARKVSQPKTPPTKAPWRNF